VLVEARYKILYTAVLISETFNVEMMLNMPRVHIYNKVRAKSIIEYGLLHRDVAHVHMYYSFIPQYIDNDKISK